MNDPAAQRNNRLMAFQPETASFAALVVSPNVTVAPPATHLPFAMTSFMCTNSSREGKESASTNTSQSPRAARAPVLRAREIWFTGSNTTSAPASRAIAAVRSMELLSHTMSSASSNAVMAARIAASEAARTFSSLKAGTTTETFKLPPLQFLHVRQVAREDGFAQDLDRLGPREAAPPRDAD